jgi:hypothetical protein
MIHACHMIHQLGYARQGVLAHVPVALPGLLVRQELTALRVHLDDPARCRPTFCRLFECSAFVCRLFGAVSFVYQS